MNNQYCYILLNQNSNFIKLSLAFFFFNPFSASHSGYHITFSLHASLGFFWLWKFLRNSLLLMTMTILSCTIQVFCRMPLKWDLSDAFLMIRLTYCVFDRKTTEVKCIPHLVIFRYMIIYIYQNDLLLLMLTLITWPRWYLFSFNNVKLLFLFTLSILNSSEGCYHVHPSLEGWGVRFHILEGR